MTRSRMDAWRAEQAALKAEWDEHYAHEFGDDLCEKVSATLKRVVDARHTTRSLALAGQSGQAHEIGDALYGELDALGRELLVERERLEATGEEAPRLHKIAGQVAATFGEAVHELKMLRRDIAHIAEHVEREQAFDKTLAQIRALPEVPTTPPLRPREQRRGRRPIGATESADDRPRPRLGRLEAVAEIAAATDVCLCELTRPQRLLVIDGRVYREHRPGVDLGEEGAYCAWCGHRVYPRPIAMAFRRLRAQWAGRKPQEADGDGEPTRTCEGCGQPFAPKRRDQRCCSATCRQRAKRKRGRDA